LEVIMVKFISIAVLLAAGCMSAHAGDGLRTADPANPEPPAWTLRWQAPLATPVPLGNTVERSLMPASWLLLGDYHFASTPGLRATGGLLGLMRPDRGGLTLAGDASGESFQLPYMGLGYTARWPQPGLRGLGWAVSADVGLLALRPRSAVRLGLGSTARDSGLAPLMQFGVSYGF
jgi:hypothetical protein